jgi:hypothetical protein
MSSQRRLILQAWWALTREERWLVASIVGLSLLGLTARYLHLRGQTPTPLDPPARSVLFHEGAQE